MSDSDPQHKYDELDALNSAYMKGVTCQEWAEECRRKWYILKSRAARGDLTVPGQGHSNADSFSREWDWKKSVQAQDLVGLEQMYTRWAMGYFAEAQVSALLSLRMLDNG
jgi:hypothetical protein